MTTAQRLSDTGRRRLLKDLPRLVRETWSLALISLALATSIWIFVAEEQNPPRQETFPARIPVEPVNVAPGFAVASVESVQVTVRAPDNVLRRLSRESFKATVDLNGVRARESSAFVLVQTPTEREVEILRVEPAFVTVTLEPRIERTVPVHIRPQGSLRTGYQVTSTRVTPAEVIVSGPESVVQLADRAVAEVVLSGLQVSLRQTYPLLVETKEGGRLAGLTVEPASATVEITVSQQTFAQAVVVVPSIKGSPAPGYTVTLVQVEPVSLRVTGPIEAMQALQSGLSTQDVDITDAAGPQDLVRTVGLKLPEGLRPDQNQVIVKVRIQPARGEQVFQVVPQISGLSSGLVGTLSPPTIEVRLSGEILSLQRLSPSNITATAEVEATAPGTYLAELKVQQPSGFQVVDWRPRLVTVTVSRR